MKERVTKAKFHIGIMAGGNVHSSFDEKGGYAMEMWPMGILVTGPKTKPPFRAVITYNNIISFDLDPNGPPQAVKEETPPQKASKAK